MRTTTARALAWFAAAALFMCFGTPLIALWAQPALPWWTAYALWATVIVATFVTARGATREAQDLQHDPHTQPAADADLKHGPREPPGPSA